MSDSRNFERLPDQAALDELHRAFSDGSGDDLGGPTDDESTSDATPEWLADDPDATPVAGDELVIVEQVPLDDEPEDARPTIVIDAVAPAESDIGSGADAAADDPTPVDDPDAPRPTIVIDDYGPGEVDTDAETPAAPVDAGPPPDVPPVSAAPDGAGPTVISIDDAELPDAVYIKGSLDADGSHAIVIIEDDEFADLDGVDVSSEARRGIEPRLRERRVAVKRAEGRRRLKWVALVSGVVVVVVGTLAVLGSSLFAVQADQISVTGNVYTDQLALDAVIEELDGTPSLRADTQALEAELERIPWVDTARIRVEFPRAATIEIRERQAWATYQGPDQRFRVLDADGRVLDVIDGQPAAYVLLGGPDAVDLQPGDFAPRGYAVAAELAKNLTGSIRGDVTMIRVTADGSDLDLVIGEESELIVRFGEARDLFAKLVRLETVLTELPENPVGTIDVSTREVTMPEDIAEGDG